ncbi:MAG: bifunctional riboflavin kinase/FAD synthetase [Bryobacteraceae bacterium]|nr:bifunctional riboflavin kinase/FAD synthetase [Bryobacteraceae bacterium]MDW8378997.1 bifunctional riboflavin kinase/FAD synthetase [Bryobacterales bacterium]
MTDLKVFRSLEEARAEFGPSALTIGNFDGVHCGHQAIFREVVQLAGQYGWKPSVLTFDPHPAKVVAPANAPPLLSTLEQRCRWIAEAGIRQIMILPFRKETAALTPEEFVRQVLVEGLQARAVLVGDNFRFGRNQSGTPQVLAELGEQFGFLARALHAVRCRGEVVSSTTIRKLVRAGRMTQAARMLGRFFCLEGKIVSGQGIGKRLTVPTLNLETQTEVIPLEGVYVSRIYDLDTNRQWPSVTNIGHRPTFDGASISIETHLLETLHGATPHRIRVEFTHRLREERRYADAEALKSQILRDAARARTWHRRFELWRRAQLAQRL